MKKNQHEIAELDRFLDDLVQDPDIPAPLEQDLDPETAACARRMVEAEQTRQPDPQTELAAQERVWQQILPSISSTYPARRQIQKPHAWPGLPRISFQTWLRVGFSAACVIAVIALGLYVSGPPAPVSAAEIMDKARATAKLPSASGVTSFALTATQRAVVTNPRLGGSAGLKGGEEILTETRYWYQSPNRWRGEYQQRIVAPDGKEISRSTAVSVGDGVDAWNYDPGQNLVVVNAAEPSMEGRAGVVPFDQEVGTLQELFQQASTCFDPQVIGNATVAGRATYVVDLGATKCPSASGPELNGRRILWVDQKTFFVLQQEQHSAADDKIILASQVTGIEYNVSVDPARFKFAPPAGATVADNRPKPAPSADQFQRQLQQLAKQVDFPVLAPGYLPSGLEPRQPKIDPMMDNLVEVTYFPASEPDKDSLAAMIKGLAIREQRATNSLVARWTEGADPTSIAGNQGWIRKGVRNADNTGSESAALVLRDGVLVSVTSFAIPPEELVKVAASLAAVPGSHAPLPNPVPPSLAELRRRVAFPIWVPASIPAGLTAEPPLGGEEPGENITIHYHTANGAIALTVVNGTRQCCPGLGMLKSEPVKLSNGVSARLAVMPPEGGGSSVWFEQVDRLISLNSPTLSKDELLKVAASMSATADPKTAPVPVRPSPTPLPPLKYTVLRPTWLPEPMTVREDRDGDIVTLGFDPRPGDAPHSVMTLREMPKASVSKGGSPDPQTTRETIGGQAVTVVKRGQSCITLEWEKGDLNLVLTNAYDPPGQPRFTCDQLRKIVESVR